MQNDIWRTVSIIWPDGTIEKLPRSVCEPFNHAINIVRSRYPQASFDIPAVSENTERIIVGFLAYEESMGIDGEIVIDLPDIF